MAWGTGLFYLLARLGTGSPIRLASLDGIHVYVGVAGGLFVLAKVARVGLRHPVEGVPEVVPWQRWLSWSMLLLYIVVFATGTLLLLPIHGFSYSVLVQLHLMTSIWALPLTTWHVWHYRARARPYLRRWSHRWRRRRLWIALALLMLPLPALMVTDPAVSQLPAVLGGGSWSPVSVLQGSYLATVARAPDGTLLAAGDALYISRDGVVWLRIDLPQPAAAAAASDQHGGHQHGQPAPPNSVTTMAVGRTAIFLGSPQGLFESTFSGQLEPLAFPGGGVRGLAMSPDGGMLWATSASGPLASAVDGRSWSPMTSGLEQPGGASAIAFLGDDLFVSDGTGVFIWRPASQSWERTSSTRSVTLLSPSPAIGTLYASTESTDLQALTGGRWVDLGLPAPIHAHHGVVHGQPAAVTSADGRLYAAGTPDGVSASADGGWTWTQLGGGLGSTSPNQVIGYQGDLLAATSDGLYRFPLTASHPAMPGWWIGLLAAAVGLGLVTLSVGVVDPRRGFRKGE